MFTERLAWYTDINHEVKEVTEGYRVCPCWGEMVIVLKLAENILVEGKSPLQERKGTSFLSLPFPSFPFPFLGKNHFHQPTHVLSIISAFP